MKNLYCGISSCSCVDENGCCLSWGFEKDIEDCRRQTCEANLKNEVPGMKMNDDYSDFNMGCN